MAIKNQLFASLVISDFEAQIQILNHPPCAKEVFALVEQSAHSHKTNLVALSPSAKALRLHLGIPLQWAQRKVPQLKIYTRNLEWEKQWQSKILILCESFTPEYKCEKEGPIHFLIHFDLTGTPLLREKPDQQIAETLQQSFNRLGFPAVSIGIASQALLASILARQAKPKGLRICPLGSERLILGPLNPLWLPGLSNGCKEKLKKYAIRSVDQLLALGRAAINLRFGQEGERLYSLANGLDLKPKEQNAKPLEVSITLARDIVDEQILKEHVHTLTDKMWFLLQKENISTDTFMLLLRYSDEKQSQRSFRFPASGFLPLAEKVKSLFFEMAQRRVALRSLHLKATRPKMQVNQLNLFDSIQEQKQSALSQAIKKIRQKGKFNDVITASTLIL